MSVLTCQACGDWIDTDDEPEAYNEATDCWLCWWCREEEDVDRYADDMDADSAAGCGPGQSTGRLQPY